MNFTKTNLEGAFVIEIQRLEDERGFFARTFCQREFRSMDSTPIWHSAIFRTTRKREPCVECTFKRLRIRKLSWCSAHRVRSTILLSIFVPIRRLTWNTSAITLTAQEHNMLYVPEGFAHGFITLED